MDELIKITEQNGKRAVSARELHRFLEATERFSNWFERQLQYGFMEGTDYVGCKVFNTLANQELTDYALTIDCAKEISMLQRNEKGKQARQYFIEIEKRYNKPMSQMELVAYSAQLLLEQSKRIDKVEEKLELIEAKSATRPGYFTIVGYATLHHVNCGVKLASSLGRKASSICKKRGIHTEEIPDPRFGKVKTYPESVLKEVFNLPVNQF